MRISDRRALGRMAVTTALVGLMAATSAVVSPGPAEATDEFLLDGRGNGHGIGMSQYGARGQAMEGRSHQQILSTYYRDTGLTTRDAPHPARIGVVLDQPRTQLVPRGGDAAIHVGDQVHTSTPGEVWEITVLSSGTCLITHPDGTTREVDPGDEASAESADHLCLKAAPTSGARIEVRRPAAGEMVTHHQYGRSSVVEVFRDRVGDTWRIDVVVATPLEEYLLGLAEVPYGWEMPALKAQAIAGRSYALHRLLMLNDPDPDRGCMCHLYDSQQDQVWDGWDREQSESWDRWRAAVQETAGVVVHAPGQIGTRDGVVQAFYSSSSNGRTEAKHELWGGEVFPYLVSVDDPWSRGEHNPFRWWQVDVEPALLAERLGMDRVDSAAVVARSTSGAATKVVFRGSVDGNATEVTRTGSWVRTALGLRSTTIDRIWLPPFTDDDGNIHESAIAWLAGEGITAGCNPPDNDRFCPEATVTRGQMAAFLTRALDLPPGDAQFTDTGDSIFAEDIAAIAEADITRGCNPPDNDRYCPHDPVTRAQMASFLTRALELTPQDEPFTDVDSSNVHARDIGALAARDITRGCNPPDNTRYCPHDPITRAQMATFLHRGMTK